MQVVRVCVCATTLLAGGAAAQETIVLPVGPTGTEPMHFELRNSGAVRLPGGIAYAGDASLVTPLGRIVLAQSELWFAFAPGTQQVQAVQGKTFVPAPLSGEVVSIDEPVIAEVGYDLGENLKDLGVPLIDKRGYLFFKFDTGLTLRIGKAPPEDLAEEEDTSFTISFPAGATARIVVDPLDPMYYFAGGITTPNRSKKPDAGGEEGGGSGSGNTDNAGEPPDDGIVTGSGNSRQGLFPFRPLVTTGIEDKAREFRGHRITTGTFPLFGLPVIVRGHLITNLDPLATGELAVDPLGIGFGPAAQAGANGRFALSLDFLKASNLGNIMNLTIPLGKATAAVEIVNGRQLAYLSGIVDPATDLGLGLLLSHEAGLQAAALVSADFAESRLYLDGLYKLGASEFGKALGIDAGDLVRIEGRLRADRAGLSVTGLSEAGVNMGPLVSQGKVTVELEIPADRPEDRYLQMAGLLRFAGLGAEGLGRLTHQGVAVTGIVTAPKFEMTMNGGVLVQPHAPPVVQGEMSVPSALNPDFHGEIRQLAREVQQDLDRKLTELQNATRDYEFELSLRGMRTIVPPATDTIIREIDRQITVNINARWPRINTLFGAVEAPGKSEALRFANAQAEPYRQRLRRLKAQMQASDSATVRAALDAAIRALLDNPRIQVTYRVPVVGVTIVLADYTLVDAALRSRLNAALAGVRALPEASSVKIRAEQVWNQVPKRELLRQTADAIESQIAAAIPRIESIGFRFPYGALEWIYQVVVTQQGKRSTVPVRLAPESIGSIGSAIGRALAQTL